MLYTSKEYAGSIITISHQNTFNKNAFTCIVIAPSGSWIVRVIAQENLTPIAW